MDIFIVWYHLTHNFLFICKILHNMYLQILSYIQVHTLSANSSVMVGNHIYVDIEFLIQNDS
jgi:oligoribonuclease (3'-5' exoribonuclease)